MSESKGSIQELRTSTALSLIAPANRVRHSGSTLHDHLIGTYEILNAWGADPDVCIAGMLHSIYSTQYFGLAIASRSRRPRVAASVGKRAERLAHFFATVDRRAIWGTKILVPGGTRLRKHGSDKAVKVSTYTIRALRLMDLANELEQQQRLWRHPGRWLATVCAGFRSIGFVPSHLSRRDLGFTDEDEREMFRKYTEATIESRSASLRLLSRCVAEIPCCAEPRLLLAAGQLALGHFGAAYFNASVALRYLRGWCVPWDNRVPIEAWELLGMQLMSAARKGNKKYPTLVAQIRCRLRRSSLAAQR